MAKETKPYGSWQSPIQVEDMLASSVGYSSTIVDGRNRYWMEHRPTEKGRQVVVKRLANGHTKDMFPAPFNARTRVHEYGGSSYTVYDGSVYFVNFADQQIYRVDKPGCEPVKVTDSSWRFADLKIDTYFNRIIAVGEEHTDEGVNNFIACVDIETGNVSKLVSGNDFFACPSLSPDGRWFAWISWDHPNMPWDNTKLWFATVAEDGSLKDRRDVTGKRKESVMYPRWSPDSDKLYFVSDRTNWWNIYEMEGFSFDAPKYPSKVLEMGVEFGSPMWGLGGSSYIVLDDGSILAKYNQQGVWNLVLISQERDRDRWLPRLLSEGSVFGSLSMDGNKLFTTVSTATKPATLALFDIESGALKVLKKSSTLKIQAGFISKPQPIRFTTTDGATAYGIYYPPTNKNFKAPKGELPPLLVKSHGGPTASAGSTLNLGIQYWTSRGFAVVDVNYRGSSGYGREYRDALKGAWGIVDRIDCESAALYLAEKGLADRNRLAITGGSAGGYTTLCALTFGDVFKAGASHYGVADLAALAGDTHKFESRYLDSLIGPYPAAQATYTERSPVHHTDQLACPVIVLQGLEDKIVPPNQAEAIVGALRSANMPVAYITFEGEQHGFRQAPNIKRAIESEFYFYSRVFGFEPADQIEPVEIENM